MLISVADYLVGLFPEQLGFLRVIRYLSFRSLMAAMTAMLIGISLGPAVIRWLTAMRIGQTVRDNGPESHLSKRGTPTMGGVLILIAIFMSAALWADWSNRFVWVVLAVTASLGALGWVDDYKKVVNKNPDGLSAKVKLLWQALVGIVVAVYLAFAVNDLTNEQVFQAIVQWMSSGFSNDGLPASADLMLPFLKSVSYPLGVFGFILLSFCVVVGTSNAVNLTDGADGLAIMPTVLVGASLGVFAYVVGNSVYSRYLLFPYIPGVGELLIICAAISGAGLAFLWFNAHPARMFMGDVGSLALGGALGAIAIIVRQEIVLFVMGGIFVVETISVMVQVIWFRYTRKRTGVGRRVLKMAPLHHHFEQSGWSETQVVIRFWIISMMLCLVGLATLKLR